LQKSYIAGAVGLGIVAIFMVVYYRLAGLVANLALAVYAVLVFAIFKNPFQPVTLTLAGGAGFILSVGMAVDANILIFERTKEELRIGKSMRSALEAGFDRAWSSIRDSNISTLITCAILIYFGATLGASIIQGFAVTLAIGVMVSMFTAIIVSRTLLRILFSVGGGLSRNWFPAA
jgi:preprotein translocase subunit SecD